MPGKTTSGRSRKVAGAEDRLHRLEQLLKREGFRHLSVSDIAAKLQCSKRSLYELATSKQELVELVITRRFARIMEAGWEAAAKYDTPPARTWAYMEVGVDALNDMGPKLLADIERDAGTAQIFNVHQRRRADGIRALVEEGVRAGYYEGFHPYLVADVMQIAFQRMRRPEFLHESGLSLSEAWDELTRLIQMGLIRRDSVPEALANLAPPPNARHEAGESKRRRRPAARGRS